MASKQALTWISAAVTCIKTTLLVIVVRGSDGAKSDVYQQDSTIPVDPGMPSRFALMCAPSSPSLALSTVMRFEIEERAATKFLELRRQSLDVGRAVFNPCLDVDPGRSDDRYGTKRA